MLKMDRRQLLKSTATMTVTAALPAPFVAASQAAAKVITPMWAVGTDGEYNWQAIAANSAEEAITQYCEDFGFVEDDGSYVGSYDAMRVPSWDGLDRSPNPGDWMRANMGHHCDRCGYETHPDACGHAVGDIAVCEDCMTIDDWQIVDPEIGAEMRAELEDQ